MTIDELHDEYGYIVDIDIDNELCVGIELEKREAKIYYLNHTPKAKDFPGYEIISEEEIEYYDLIDDFPEVFVDCENAEAFFRGDIFDDEELEIVLGYGQEELENKSITVLESTFSVI